MSTYFGLDIGSSSIKIAKSSVVSAKSFQIESLGLAMNPAGSVDFSKPEVTTKLASVVKQLIAEAKIKEKRVVVGVAESRVYSRILSLPSMSEAELASAIKWEAEQFVPVPVEEVELDFSVIKPVSANSQEKKILVYLVAAPKKYLVSLVDFVSGIGLEPIAVESEMVAVSRSLSFGGVGATTLIVHMGAMSTVLAIVDDSSLSFSYVTDTGGVALTRALAQSLTLLLPQAEEYKRTYGLDPSQLEGKVRTGLLIVLEGIVSEIRKAMEFHLSAHQSQVTRIVLSGGGSYLPSLPAYLSEVLGGVEVMLADPLALSKPEKGMVLPSMRAVYSVAIGLSQRMI